MKYKIYCIHEKKDTLYKHIGDGFFQCLECGGLATKVFYKDIKEMIKEPSDIKQALKKEQERD